MDSEIRYKMAISRISGRRHPTRKQSATLMGSMGIVFLLFLSVLLFCPMVSATAGSSPNVATEKAGIIGIDLGTTYSCVGVYRNGRVEIIPNSEGSRTTPSWVSFTGGRGGEVLVGADAKSALSTDTRNTIYDVKRLIGRRMDESGMRESIEGLNLPFDIASVGAKAGVKVHGKVYTPEEISAVVLKKLKADAEAYLGHPVSEAVVTVPAYFNDAQRQATREAGRLAGLNILRVINEPTAAALAYGRVSSQSKSRAEAEESKVVVYDLGGGTFDVSILSIEDGVYEVLATAGDTHLGGEDFDMRLKALFGDAGENITKVELENAKKTLSSEESVTVGGVAVTRKAFERANKDLFERTMEAVERALKDANVKKTDIDEIVLVGGSTRIPRIQSMLAEYFGKQPNRGIDPDEAVAFGAAIQGAILNDIWVETTLLDITSLTLGIETEGKVFTPVLERGTVIPTKKSQIFSTTKDNQESVMIRVLEEGDHLLGEFLLKGIQPAAKGVPQIEVTFEMDANSILTINALDKTTLTSESIRIKRDEL